MALTPPGRFDDRFVRWLNRPVRVRWDCWTTTTLEMKRHGWEVRVSEDPMSFTIRLAFRNDKYRCVGYVAFSADLFHRSRVDVLEWPEVPIEVRMGTEVLLNEIPAARWYDLDSPIPRHTPNVTPLSRLGVFASVPLDEGHMGQQQIVVEKEDVGVLMQRILELQSPRQKEILKATSDRKVELIEPAKVLTFSRIA